MLLGELGILEMLGMLKVLRMLGMLGIVEELCGELRIRIDAWVDALLLRG